VPGIEFTQGEHVMTTLMRRLSAVTSVWMLATLMACGGGNEASTPPPAAASGAGAVEGVVLASRDSQPVAGATVTAAGRTVTTDAEGRFRLDDVDAGATTVRVRAAEFVEGTVPVAVSAGQTVRAQARLVRESAATTLDPQAAATISVPGSTAAMDLSADSLVIAATSAAPSGPVTARLTPIDPAADPQSMPGGFINDAGVSIESFGAMSIVLEDGAGSRLALRSGRTAVVRIPLASRSVFPPASVPLFFLDEATGRWVERGSAALTQADDQPVFEATIDQLAVWNVDKPLEGVVVKGCVTGADGKPAPGATVKSEGIDYSGSDGVTADAQGRFSVVIRSGGRAALEAETDTATGGGVVVGPSAADLELAACLVVDQAVQPPRIVQQPSSASTWQGLDALFQGIATGGSGLKYQWRRNGEDLAGETYSWLSFPPALSDSGARYSVVVSNAAGTVTSEEAVLTVVAADLEAQREHLQLTYVLFDFYEAASAAFLLVDDEGRFSAPAGVCGGGGNVAGTFNGLALPVGEAMPLSGVLAATFDACQPEEGEDFYSGATSVAYEIDARQESGLYTFTADAMRIRRASMLGDAVEDLVSTGGATAAWSGFETDTSFASSITLIPTPGSSLRNETTGRLAVFESGSIWFKSDGASGARTRMEWGHDTMRFTVDGVPYVSSGALKFEPAADGPGIKGSGEVALWTQGRRVGRLYATDDGLFTDIGGTVQPLDAAKSAAARVLR
jgi:hypothetical protein